MKGKNRKTGAAWERKLLALAVASCFAAELSYANPTGPTVTHGQATFATNGNSLTVTNTPGAVINWQSFGIASQEITRFLQQSAASAVLNRVTGVTPSTILGQLQSNGRVFLINPNGITIGKGAVIDVAGFVASSLNLSDGDFLAGRQRFTETPGAGAVVNRGEIKTSTGGMVYLVGQNIENHGVIRTPQGEIVLAAGKTIELVDAGTPEIRVQITAPDNQALNLGQLFASGGRIGMYAGLVRHGGTANANTAVVGENGKIVFKAVKDVKLEAGSVTTASGPTAGSIKVEAQSGTAVVAGTVEANATAGRGGIIDISGQQGITVEPTGRIAANGIEGGSIALNSAAGPVQVAGQIRADASAGRGGQVAIAAASQASLTAGARLSANGTQAGGSVGVNAVEGVKLDGGSALEANGAAGGTVIVNAEQGPVEVSGTIEATGSRLAGGNIKVTALSDITLGDTSVISVMGRSGGTTHVEAREGTLLASGVIDAFGRDGPGGKVLLLGPRVGLVRNAFLNASGLTGGGTVLVGGDFQGKNPEVRNAERTYVGPDVLITADAIETGNGGKVIIWADGDTRFHGQVSARGGDQTGDGGFVEVSGKQYLDYRGLVDTRAPMGATGTLLLDPTEISIVSGAVTDTLGITCTGGGCLVPATGPFTDTATVPLTGGTLADATINAQLSLASVTVLTSTGDIVINGGVAIAPSPGPANGNTLTLDSAANISWTGGWSYTNNGALTLKANGGNITGTGTLTVSSSLALSATGDIGASAAARLNVSTATLAARGANVFIAESDAVILADVNGVSNSATTTYDLTAGAITVTGTAIGGGTNTYLDGSSITGAGSVSGTNVALTATGDIGTSAGARLSTVAGTLAADGANVFIDETNGVTLDTVNSVNNSATGEYVLTAGNTIAANGNITAGGNVDLRTGAGNIAIASGAQVISSGGSGTLQLIAAGAITAGGLSTATELLSANGAVRLEAGSTIGSSTNRIDIQTGTLAASAAGQIFIREADGLVVNQVAGLNSAPTLSGIIGAGLVLSAGGTLTIQQNVTANGAGTVALETTAGDVAVNNSATVSSASGTIQVIAAGAITTDTATNTGTEFSTNGGLRLDALGGGISTTNNRIDTNVGTLAARANGSIFVDEQSSLVVGSVAALDGQGPATLSGISTVGGSNGNIALTTGNTLTIQRDMTADGVGTVALRTVAGNVAVNDSATVSSGSGMIQVIAGGAITTNTVTNTGTEFSTSGGLRLDALGGGTGTAGNRIDTNVGTLATRSTGNIFLDEQNALIVGSVAVLDGQGPATLSGISTVGGSNGNITLATGNTLTVQQNVAADGAGTVALKTAAGDVAVNNAATVSSGSGTIQVIAAGAITTDTATNTGTEFSTSGGLRLDALGGGIGAAGNRIDTNVGTVAARADGSIFVDEQNALIVGSVAALDGQGPATLNGAHSVTGNVTISADGAVTQTAPIIATRLQLLGGGSYTLNLATNDVDIIIADGPTGVNYRDSNALIVGTAGAGMDVAGDIQLRTGGALTINNTITTTANGSVTLNNAGDLTINAAISADGNVLQNGAGITLLNSDIFTSRDLVEFEQDVVLGGTGDRVIDTSTNTGTGAGGTIRFLGDLAGRAGSLTKKSLTMVTPGISGDVQINGTATDLNALTITNAQNVSLQAVTTTGAVNITAQGTAALEGALSSGSDVTLRVNDLALTGTIDAGANAVQVRTATLGQPIRLGSTGAGGNILHISDAELDNITTTRLLTIGGPTHTGAITVAGAISPANADGGFSIVNRQGGIAVNADVTYNGVGAAGDLTLTANGGNFTVGAITDGNSGSPFEIRATNLTVNAATGIGTGASPIDVIAGTTTASNVGPGTNGVFLRAPNGNMNVAGLTNDGSGTVSLRTIDGSINVNGAINNAGGAVELTANATGSAPRTLSVNEPVTANGRVILRAADDITIDSQVNSGGGDIYVIAGKASGMNVPGVAAASEPLDTIGGVTIRGRILAGAGDIVINATESVIQAPQPAPNTGGGGSGLQNTGDLIVRTYNNTPGAGVIDLRHDDPLVGNTNGRVTLETRFANDASAPAEPGNGYAASNIDYRSYTGVILSGIGTSADFVAIAATQNIDLNALNIQAKNLTLIANNGDVNVNTQITNAQINSGRTGGSLNLLASGNVNVNHVPGKSGVTIGRVLPNATLHDDTGLPEPDSIEKFDHDLKLVAQGDINISGSIYLKGDLRLRADASLAEATSVGGVAGYGDGIGSVNIFVPTGVTDPVIVSARHVIVGTRDANNNPLPVQNLTITAGELIPAAGAGVRQSTSASLEAVGNLEIFLTGDMTLTGGTINAVKSAPGTAVIDNAATATIGGNVVTIRGLKHSDNTAEIPIRMTENNSNITLTGGNATAGNPSDEGVAKADASAVILAGQSATIDIGGDFTIRGGHAAASGANAKAIAIAGTEIGTQITGTELLMVSSRDMYITSGTRNATAGGVADGFASLASSGAIRINVTGEEGLVLDGAGGSGLFDALGESLVRVIGNGYPITVNGRVQLRHPVVPNPLLQDALAVAGAPLIDESLLAAFLRATEAAREETIGQDPNLQGRGTKGQAGVCK